MSRASELRERGLKWCSKCDTVKPFENFYKNRTAHDGVQGICKECSSEYFKEYSKENRELKAELHRKWREANPTWSRDYYKSNRTACIGYVIKHRERKRGAEVVDFTAEQWNSLVDSYDGRCAYCGEIADPITQDHLIPVSRGGNHTLTNIVPACQPCNSQKNDKTPLEYFLAYV